MIKIKPSHKGRLHEALGVKGPISTSLLDKKRHSRSKSMRRMVAFALAERKWHH